MGGCWRFVLKRASDGRYFRAVPSRLIDEEWTEEIWQARQWFDVAVVSGLAERWNSLKADQLVIEGVWCER